MRLVRGRNSHSELWTSVQLELTIRRHETLRPSQSRYKGQSAHEEFHTRSLAVVFVTYGNILLFNSPGQRLDDLVFGTYTFCRETQKILCLLSLGVRPPFFTTKPDPLSVLLSRFLLFILGRKKSIDCRGVGGL